MKVEYKGKIYETSLTKEDFDRICEKYPNFRYWGTKEYKYVDIDGNEFSYDDIKIIGW